MAKSNGIEPLKPQSANAIKEPKYGQPNQTGPDIQRDINDNYNQSDFDFAQMFYKMGVQDVNNMHTKSDVDRDAHAQHHTLGYSRNQASPGDHVHDGKTSKPIGQGLSLSVTGSKGGNVALANLITMLKQVISFTDTTT